MSPLPAKVRLLLLLPAAPLLVAVAAVGVLAYGRSISLINHPNINSYIQKGYLTVQDRTPAVAIGPSAELFDLNDGQGPRYRNFAAMSRWRAALPQTVWSRFGIQYASVPRLQLGAPNFTADRHRAVGVHLGWLIAFPLTVAAVAAVPYRRARRRHARLHASACPSCGYDLRASPDRCPECGATATTAVSA